MDEGQARWIAIMVLAALILGLVVLYVRNDYRFEPIIESNKNYYPSVRVEAP